MRTLPPNIWPISRTSGISQRKWIFSFRGHDRIICWERKLLEQYSPSEWLLIQDIITAWSSARQIQAHSEVYTSSYKIMSKNPIHIKVPYPHTRIVFCSIQFSPYSDHIINHKGPMANKIASSLGRTKQ